MTRPDAPDTGAPFLPGMLQGVPPADATPLDVEGVSPDGIRAWRLGRNVYLRTRYTLLSPEWTASEAEGGTTVYAVPSTPVVLLSVNGRTVSALLSGAGRAGPRRLAVIALSGTAIATLVVVVALSGHHTPPVSRDARMKPVDPLPGGLHSTPEMNALNYEADTQQAQAALKRGESYTPPLAPSVPMFQTRPCRRLRQPRFNRRGSRMRWRRCGW